VLAVLEFSQVCVCLPVVKRGGLDPPVVILN
jgi:hypothetical protein